MKASDIILTIGAGLSLALAIEAQAATNTLDWTFSSAGQTSPINLSGTTNTSGGTPTATFANNFTYFFNTGPGGASGYFGPPTGLWDVNGNQLTLTLAPTPYVAANYTLTIAQFIDNELYPGTVSFSVPNAQFVSRNVVVPQSGNMGGFWAADIYSWSNVSLLNGTVSLVISPAGPALLLDEVKLTVVNVVPEPGVSQIAAIGLIAFGMVSWFRRTRNA